MNVCRAGVLLACGAWGVAAFGGDAGKGEREMRLEQVVEANIIGIHAYQCGLALKSETADKAAWSCGALTTNDLAALVQHHYALLAEPPIEVRHWVEGRASAFDPARDLTPLAQSPLRTADPHLPVNVFTTFLQAKTNASAVQARALASLLQMQMDIDRDGDQLQKLYALYVALGLPVHTAQLGMAAKTDAEFLALAKEVAPRWCACPFHADAASQQMQFRKMWNWGHRYTGDRDKVVLARELLQEPEVAALVPKLKALPPQRIAVIGHSYTMNVHWASPSASVPIAAEVLAHVNPAVEVRHWQAGGMTAGRADCRKFFEEALAWKPDRVLIVVAVRTPEDAAALEKMVSGFIAAGAQVAMFDTLHGKLKVASSHAFDEKAIAAIAGRTGMALIPVGDRINGATNRDTFVALDNIHMTEPYHRLMAKAWLEFLVAPVPSAAGSAHNDSRRD
jgi:hypothetical protein